MEVIRNKATVVGFSYFMGICKAQFLHSAQFAGVSLTLIIVGCCLIGALVCGVQRNLRKFLEKSQVIALILLASGMGLLAFTIYDVVNRQPVLDMAGESVLLEGVVEEKSTVMFERSVYIVRAKVGGASNRISPTTTKVAVSAPDYEYINVGDKVQADVTLSQFRDSGVFPEHSYNLSRGVLLKGESESIEFMERGVKTPICYIREYNSYIKGEILTAFPNDNGALLNAVCLGDRSWLAERPGLAQDIRVAGIVHYTAVSGLHMTMVVHMFMLIFAFTPFSNNRRVRFAVLVCLVVALAIFFDLSRSVVRSAVMLIIYYGGEVVWRKGATVNSLGFALLLILLFEPYAALDSGLMMSFAGTFGVGVVSPALMRLKEPPPVSTGHPLRRGRLVYLLDAFVVSVCACFCVLPVSALFFGGVSVIAPVVSVIILPFFTVAVGSVVLFAMFSWIPGVAGVFMFAAGVMSGVMNTIIGFFGRFTAAYISLDYWFIPIWIGLAIASIAVIWLIYRNMGKAVKAACLTVTTLVLMICVYNLNVVNSGRTYITIYSDSVSAWASVRQSGTEAVIITDDTLRALDSITQRNRTPTVLALLGASRNNESAFSADILPDCGVVTYDISGRFTLCVRDHETLLKIDDFSILFTRAGNDDASPANVTVASGWVRNKREFDSDYVVYVSKSVQPEHRGFRQEHNAYYEPIYLMLEKDKL